MVCADGGSPPSEGGEVSFDQGTYDKASAANGKADALKKQIEELMDRVLKLEEKMKALEVARRRAKEGK